MADCACAQLAVIISAHGYQLPGFAGGCWKMVTISLKVVTSLALEVRRTSR
jgi:hypothetical protein